MDDNKFNGIRQNKQLNAINNVGINKAPEKANKNIDKHQRHNQRSLYNNLLQSSHEKVKESKIGNYWNQQDDLLKLGPWTDEVNMGLYSERDYVEKNQKQRNQFLLMQQDFVDIATLQKRKLEEQMINNPNFRVQEKRDPTTNAVNHSEEDSMLGKQNIQNEEGEDNNYQLQNPGGAGDQNYSIMRKKNLILQAQGQLNRSTYNYSPGFSLSNHQQNQNNGRSQQQHYSHYDSKDKFYNNDEMNSTSSRFRSDAATLDQYKNFNTHGQKKTINARKSLNILRSLDEYQFREQVKRHLIKEEDNYQSQEQRQSEAIQSFLKKNQQYQFQTLDLKNVQNFPQSINGALRFCDSDRRGYSSQDQADKYNYQANSYSIDKIQLIKIPEYSKKLSLEENVGAGKNESNQFKPGAIFQINSKLIIDQTQQEYEVKQNLVNNGQFQIKIQVQSPSHTGNTNLMKTKTEDLMSNNLSTNNNSNNNSNSNNNNYSNNNNGGSNTNISGNSNNSNKIQRHSSPIEIFQNRLKQEFQQFKKTVPPNQQKIIYPGLKVSDLNNRQYSDNNNSSQSKKLSPLKYCSSPSISGNYKALQIVDNYEEELKPNLDQFKIKNQQIFPSITNDINNVDHFLSEKRLNFNSNSISSGVSQDGSLSTNREKNSSNIIDDQISPSVKSEKRYFDFSNPNKIAKLKENSKLLDRRQNLQLPSEANANNLGYPHQYSHSATNIQNPLQIQDFLNEPERSTLLNDSSQSILKKDENEFGQVIREMQKIIRFNQPYI